MCAEPHPQSGDMAAARDLSGRIRELALQGDYLSLLAIAVDPETVLLLELLPDEQAGAANVHLEAARRWRDQRRAANRRRLAEARTALDRFDLTLAGALLQRLEAAHMTAEDLTARDDLLLELEARAIEEEELQRTAGEVQKEVRPRRRWWSPRSR